MTSENQANEVAVDVESDFAEEFDSPSENHRMAAHHFSEAAKEHELAADAYDAGDQTSSEMHSFKAYRHQLNAVQYSEIAVMEAFELNEINEI
jgi:hypothetical protein